MAKEAVYIETSVVSYLVARISANQLIARRQEITRAWWSMRDNFVLMISPEVLDEVAEGDASYAKCREDALLGIQVLVAQEAVGAIAEALLKAGVIPTKCLSDAIHLGFATAYAADALITWNLKHLANLQSMKRAREIITMLGFNMPTICTPEQLLASGGE
jgi:predicted nucleic acid-binding protein